MSRKVTHHLPPAMLAQYAAGRLSYAFSVLAAAHVSLCRDCRDQLAAHEAAAGLLLEEAAPAAVSEDLLPRLLARLEEPAAPQDRQVENGARPSGIYPGPVMMALKGRPPRWWHLGSGIRQALLHHGPGGSLRLLSVPAGRPVPRHTHRGTEFTLVLQGGVHDETGHFSVGDVEVADARLEHTPTADPGEACICLAATDAPLRFSGIVPRLLQPLFRI